VGGFKAFPIQDDEHLVTVVRYVERNPLRAGLVALAEDWPWSSLAASAGTGDVMPKLATDELLRRGDWPTFVNQPMTEAEVEAIQRAIRRGRPFGSEAWTQDTAKRLGLEFSLRSRGGQRRETILPNPPK
jgi:putative transposase